MAKYIYDKSKGYFIGLPARDMSEKEWESYPKELQQAAIDAGLYKIKSEKKEVKDA